MKFLKFLVVVLTIFMCFTFSFGYLSEKEVISTIVNYYDKTPSELVNNEYRKEIDESFVHSTNDFIADSKEELLNIYYTVMSSGMKQFTFYCGDAYELCIHDILEINNDDDLLSQINNFVHVFNSFKSIKTTYTTSGKITLFVNRIYDENSIELINNKLDELEKVIIDENSSDYKNILSIHDYIINHTKYNVEDENKPNTDSSKAIGVLFNGKATCNGYTDTASLLLDRLGIKNIRISNDKHIWNLVYLNGKWLHLDLTWDDPVNSANKDVLLHDFFLKETKDMNEKHVFDKEIFNFI